MRWISLTTAAVRETEQVAWKFIWITLPEFHSKNGTVCFAFACVCVRHIRKIQSSFFEWRRCWHRKVSKLFTCFNVTWLHDNLTHWLHVSCGHLCVVLCVWNPPFATQCNNTVNSCHITIFSKMPFEIVQKKIKWKLFCTFVSYRSFSGASRHVGDIIFEADARLH